MAKYSLIIIFFFVSTSLIGQRYDLPPNAEAGKCYEKCFDYNKKLTWTEVGCDIVLENRKHNLSKTEILETKKAEIKLRKYQEKLLALGYEVIVNGVLDANTIAAHHKFLKEKKKTERKEKKPLRKKSQKL